jgi:deazaflavin-dependent oxidoreductase (nitroreductase family)
LSGAGRTRRGLENLMATYKVGRLERSANLIAKLFVRAGIGSVKTHLLTVVGRRTGRAHTTPVTVLALDGERWLVGPYGNVSWVQNTRACGQVTLSRRGYRETLVAREVDAVTAAPILKAYLAIEPITRPAFKIDPDASLHEWASIAPKHPVFRLEKQGTPENTGGS